MKICYQLDKKLTKFHHQFVSQKNKFQQSANFWYSPEMIFLKFRIRQTSANNFYRTKTTNVNLEEVEQIDAQLQKKTFLNFGTNFVQKLINCQFNIKCFRFWNIIYLVKTYPKYIFAIRFKSVSEIICLF